MRVTIMKGIPSTSSMRPTYALSLGVAVVLTLLCLSNAASEDGVWTVGPRKVPPPLGASAELRQSIAATPQPDVEAVAAVSPKSSTDWAQIVDPRDQATAEANRNLAKEWSVKITETKIGGVPVFEVTPPKLDPSLADKLFVHTHGGAYVLSQGWAGLNEAILIAHRVGVPVISIDYRMPPKAPYPAAIDDVIAVWRELLRKREASSMAIGGTSAGGNLTLASVLRTKELKLPLPAVVMASTPWADPLIAADRADARPLNRRAKT
jgi:monoterpene epsilon-lactone hydrolase